MRIRMLIAVICGLWLAVPPAVADDMFRDDHPERYTVESGDTLWDISERFLEDAWLWPEIWHVNPDIENPHLIYPGDVIVLVYIDGEPRLTVERGERTVRLSPETREEQLEPAISTIPMEAIRPFLSRSRVLDEDVLDSAAYIIAGEDERVMASRGDSIYVRRLPDEDQDAFTIVRKGDPYVDPETDDVLGFEATYVGDARILDHGDPGTARVASSNREILPGDRLVETPTDPIRTEFQPRAPEQDVAGYIIDVMDGVTQIGQFDVVVLNRGEEHGLEEGHVLSVFQAGREIRDDVAGETVTLPEERAGELIVFRVFDRLSFGLVMRAERAMNTMDIVRTP
ncbi:LysM peptidoglycan-binding domain-containing protein [Aquisalimonas asiatica]|uniref:LysM domain-containing protein n=1 Tax=Aquisalimonas asiatica TaxID=406100 RepID=A0A1H8TBZ4_9GAMM|nr:LysM peptidoglycan-binding domain-containing protein [Aquisalimonas asiatica]SEO88447.1 LysM domain-containing protein [Aquisalimonas asiatica]